MSIQASVYNRSWLKPQWEKFLVLIVIIVPLVVAQHTKEEWEEIPLGKAPEPSGRTEDIELYFARTIRDSVFPREGEEPASRNRRLFNAVGFFSHRTPGERDNWLWLMMEFIRNGHFDFASKLMDADPSFFRPTKGDLDFTFHDKQEDLAFSHEGLALLAKKTEVAADDLKHLASIIANSDCAEWKEGGLQLKNIDESCKHVKEIEKRALKKDEDYFKFLAANYKARVDSCEGPQEKDCLKLDPSGGVINKFKDAFGVIRKIGDRMVPK